MRQTPLPNSLWPDSCSTGNFPKSAVTYPDIRWQPRFAPGLLSDAPNYQHVSIHVDLGSDWWGCRVFAGNWRTNRQPQVLQTQICSYVVLKWKLTNEGSIVGCSPVSGTEMWWRQRSRGGLPQADVHQPRVRQRQLPSVPGCIITDITSAGVSLSPNSAAQC